MHFKPVLATFFLLLQVFTSSVFAEPGPSFFSVGRNQGQAIGVDTPYSTVEILSFLSSEQTIIPFFNIKAGYFDKGAGVIGNVGAGVRFAPETSSLFYGLNGYYDYRETHGSNYSRLGLGVELFGERFGFRANGYAPVGKTRSLISTCVFDDYIGDYFMIRDKYLVNRGGGDFSFDYVISNGPSGFFRLGLGGYYFNGSDGSSKIFGPEYRVTAGFTEYFGVGVLGTYDKVFGNKVQAQITLTLPLGGSSNGETGLFQNIQRNDFMILQDRCCWTTNF
jgi:hypothetical protein